MSNHEVSPATSKTDTSTFNDNPLTFQAELIGRSFAQFYASKETQISAPAVETAAEYLRIFTRECIWRAHVEAQRDIEGAKVLGGRVLEVEDIRKVATSLVLDF